MEALIVIGSIIAVIGIGYGLFRLYGYVRDTAEDKYDFEVFGIKYVAGFFVSIATGIAAAVVQNNSIDKSSLTTNTIVLIATAAIIAIALTVWLIKNTDFTIGVVAAAFQFVAALLAVVVIVVAFALLSNGKKTRKKMIVVEE